jgi:hypothetical protein
LPLAAILVPAILLSFATVFDEGWAQNGAQSRAELFSWFLATTLSFVRLARYQDFGIFASSLI